MFLFSISFAKSSKPFSFAKAVNYLRNLYFMLMDHVLVLLVPCKMTKNKARITMDCVL